MHYCINCGKNAAQRIRNDFVCEACGFAWDVDFEQSMAHYLAAQGRKPAEPMPEEFLSVNSTQIEPTQADPPEERVRLTVLDTDGSRGVYHALIDDYYTVPQLTDLAAEHDVPLSSQRKLDIMNALIDAGVFAVHEVEDADGEIVHALTIGGVEVPLDEDED